METLTNTNKNMNISESDLKYTNDLIKEDDEILVTEKKNNFGPGSARSKKKWSDIEDNLLLEIVSKKTGKKKWKEIASFFNNKSAIQCRSRWERIKPGIKSGRWTTEEDEKLRVLFNQYGKKWYYIARRLNNRTGKQVRERFKIVLDSTHRRGKLKKEEKLRLIQLYNQIGPNWISIKKMFNDEYNAETLKNAFYAFYRRKEKNGEILFKNCLDQQEKDSPSVCKLNENTSEEFKTTCSKNTDSIISEVFPNKKSTPQTISKEINTQSNIQKEKTIESPEFLKSFQTHLLDANCNVSCDPNIFEQILIFIRKYELEMQRLNFYNTYNIYLQSASIYNKMNSLLQNYAAMYIRSKYESFCDN